MALDQDQQWLVNCLSATLDPNQQVRSYAEASLNQAALQPGFGLALSKVAANRELQFGLRQNYASVTCLTYDGEYTLSVPENLICLFSCFQAAVLLKQYIKKHWQEGEECFEHPAVPIEEKVAIRRLLLSSLDDPQKKICTAVSMAVASIGVYDWPEDWPDLLPFLLKLINDQNNMNGVNGALRCLALLSGDLDDTIVPSLVPSLFPCLLNIVSSPHIYNNYLLAKAISIVYACTSVLGTMSGVYMTETCSLMAPMIKPWIDRFSIILGHPVQPEDPDDWSVRMEVFKCLNQFVQNFPTVTESAFVVILGSLWQTFLSSLAVYVTSSVEGERDAYDGRYDSDGAEQSLDSFVIQLFEFLLTVVGSKKFLQVIENSLKDLVYHTITFLQMTEQQIHTWSMDANQFVADEDEATYSCRVSGALLLEEVAACGGTEGIGAIIDGVRKHFTESQGEKASGSLLWWRRKEAVLFALSSMSDELLGAEDSGYLTVRLGSLLEQMINEDLGLGVHEYPFLYARLFTTVAKFSSAISPEVLESFLQAAIRAVGMGIPAVVKVGACQALSELLPGANEGILQPHMMELMSSLTDLLHQASDETLHLVLETLQAAIRAGGDASAAVEATITPIILSTWVSHVADPFISIEAIEVLEALKNARGCFHQLASRILPYIGQIIDNPQHQPEGLVAGSLDLLNMLLKNAPTDITKAAFDVCFNAVVRMVLLSEDHSEMQNATECLSSFVSGGRQELLSWGSDSGFTMRSLLDAASRLLDPELDSSGSLFVGSYILQLILHLPSQMAQHIRDLTAALIRRMQSTKIVALKSSMLLIFARLIHISAPDVDRFVDLLINIPAEGYQDALAYVMSEWSKQQGEIQGSYQIKVTTTALALLLSTSHAELGKIVVQGHLVESSPGITTRSKAKSAPDNWTMIPLTAKIFSLLAEQWIEIQEQSQHAEDEDSEWEEIGGDMDAEKEFLHSAAAPPRARSTYEHLGAVAKLYNENEDVYEDDTLRVSDPLNEINLSDHLVEFFRKFSQSDKQLFDHLCQNLTKAQKSAVQMVLNG